MKQYQFLLFDLDRTLLDFDADMLVSFEKLYRQCGYDRLIPYSHHMLELYEKHNERWWRRFEAGECSKQELFLGRFADFLNETGFSGEPEQLNRQYFEFLGQGGKAYPGALEMVKLLSEKMELYITTNGNAATANTRIRNSGLLPFIKGYFVSETIGHAKPDPRYFEYVFSHIPGFQKERALVIGDSLATDIQGACRAGVDSLWYHPDGAQNPSAAAHFTYQAQSFEEILDLLAPDRQLANREEGGFHGTL